MTGRKLNSIIVSHLQLSCHRISDKYLQGHLYSPEAFPKQAYGESSSGLTPNLAYENSPLIESPTLLDTSFSARGKLRTQLPLDDPSRVSARLCTLNRKLEAICARTRRRCLISSPHVPAALRMLCFRSCAGTCAFDFRLRLWAFELRSRPSSKSPGPT